RPPPGHVRLRNSHRGAGPRRRCPPRRGGGRSDGRGAGRGVATARPRGGRVLRAGLRSGGRGARAGGACPERHRRLRPDRARAEGSGRRGRAWRRAAGGPARRGSRGGGIVSVYDRPSDPAKRQSAALTDGPARAAARAMLKAVGLGDDDLARPLVGVATSWIETMPCNWNQRELAKHVKAGIRAAGGTPLEFSTSAV